MGVKNCPETARQKMINMMYIVLTAMLALNVAAEVLEAFRVVDSSLTQTIKTVNMKNSQVYSSFEQAYAENPAKVQEWKQKADLVKAKTDSLITKIWQLKEDIVMTSGGRLVTPEYRLRADDPFFINEQTGDTIKIQKEDDLNTPSEMMITQKKGYYLKKDIEEYKNSIISLINEDDVDLRKAILQELNTSDPPAKLRDGGERKTWEVQNFENKPLIAVLTLLSKVQIDIKNAESHMINYLYAQIDAGSFKFNALRAQVIANSNVVLQGDEYTAEIFLAAIDTTQYPQVYINNKLVEIVDGKAIYRGNTNSPGTFKWGGLIKYKTPAGIYQNYPFEQEYQVTPPSVTVSATKMNVFYKGLDNPVDVAVPGVPKENLRVEMSNGTIRASGKEFLVRPTSLDELGRKTTISVYATIAGTERLMGTTQWRVKQVPDPVAQIAGKTGGNIRKEELLIQDGVLAVLEDFLFDLNFTITQFDISITGAGGFVSTWKSRSNRFTPAQKEQFKRLTINTIVYIDNIVAKGDDGTTRSLTPVSFKIR
ncbi:MAG: gliding motility protein GldM [Chlorobi bacterium]|nr:gliding motility protein GldM [Chlorobiota bacterium]